MKSDAAKFAAASGVLVAAVLVLVWFLFSLIAWDFTVTAIGVRALLVISLAAAALAFVMAKIAKL